MGPYKIEDGVDIVESSGASELVDERSVGRVIVLVTHFVEIVENGEEFVGVFALFEIVEKWDGLSELISCELMRAWFFCGFATGVAVDVIRLYKFVQLVLQFERGELQSWIYHGSRGI